MSTTTETELSDGDKLTIAIEIINEASKQIHNLLLENHLLKERIIELERRKYDRN